MGEIQDLLRPALKGRCLDAATGRGDFLDFIGDISQDLRIAVGVDNSIRAIPAWQKRSSSEREVFACMDAARLAFDAKSFDVVCISNSLHHLADREAVIGEMRRVLKTGGAFIVNEMVCDGQSDKQMTHVALHHWSAEVDRTAGLVHNATFTRAELQGIYAELGLGEVRVAEYTEEGDDNEETARRLVNACETYAEKVKGSPEYALLKEKGEAVKRRVLEVGFAAATEVVMVGRKI